MKHFITYLSSKFQVLARYSKVLLLIVPMLAVSNGAGAAYYLWYNNSCENNNNHTDTSCFHPSSAGTESNNTVTWTNIELESGNNYICFSTNGTSANVSWDTGDVTRTGDAVSGSGTAGSRNNYNNVNYLFLKTNAACTVTIVFSTVTPQNITVTQTSTPTPSASAPTIYIARKPTVNGTTATMDLQLADWGCAEVTKVRVYYTTNNSTPTTSSSYWDITTSQTSNANFSVTKSGLAFGTYNIKVAAYNDEGFGGLSDMTSFEIACSIPSTPSNVSALSVTTTYGGSGTSQSPFMVCPSQNLTFNVASTLANGVTGFIATVNDNYVENGTSALKDATAAITKAGPTIRGGDATTYTLRSWAYNTTTSCVSESYATEYVYVKACELNGGTAKADNNTSGVTIEYNQSASIDVTGYTEGGSLLWYSSTDGENYSPTVVVTHNFNSGNLTASTWYKAQITNVCDETVFSTAVKVTVLPQAKTIEISDEEICDGSSVDVTIKSAASGIIYTVYDGSSSVVGSGTGANSDLSISITPTASTTYTVKGKECVACTEKTMSNTASVTVNSNPTFTPSSDIKQFMPVTIAGNASSTWTITTPSPKGDAWLSDASGATTVLKAPTGTYVVTDTNTNCNTGSITVGADSETCN